MHIQEFHCAEAIIGYELVRFPFLQVVEYGKSTFANTRRVLDLTKSLSLSVIEIPHNRMEWRKEVLQSLNRKPYQ